MTPIPRGVNRAAFLHHRAQVQAVGRPATQRGENFITNSGDYDGAFWNGSVSGYFAFFPWQGPWGGGNVGTLIGASGTPSPNATITSDTFVLPAGSGPVYTISAWVEQSVAGMAGTGILQLTNPTKSALFQLGWVYPVGNIPVHANHTGAGGYAITQTDGEDSSWYRLSAYLDTTAAPWAGDSVSAVIRPYGTDTVANHGVVVHGVQVHSGASPIPFIARP